MLIAGKLKKRFSIDGAEITILASLRIANGKVQVKQIEFREGRIDKRKIGVVAKAIMLYLATFNCSHHWRIDMPHTPSNMRGLKKYSNGVCLRCNTVRKRFNNFLPENAYAPRIKETIVLIKKPVNDKENILLLSFSSFVVLGLDNNTFKVRKGSL